MTLQAIKPVTAEELLAMGDNVGRCELIQGEIIEITPAGCEHGGIEVEIIGELRTFVKAHKLGRVYPGDTGFIIHRKPDTVRVPDVAFVRKRVPRSAHRGYFDGAPDLAVEVISPSDSWSQVLAKKADWLNAGTVAVWVADPPSKTIHVYHANQPAIIYQSNDDLHDETILPGFVLQLAEVFGEA